MSRRTKPEPTRITHGSPPCGAVRLLDLPFAGLNFAILSDGSIRRIVGRV